MKWSRKILLSFAQVFTLLKALWSTFYVFATPFCACLAQASDYYPNFISGYFYNMSFANPSYVPSEAKADFALNYQFSTGAIKDISTTAFSAARVWGQENRSAHVGRVQVYDEQEGPYIHYPRTYLNYAYRLQTGENSQLSAGICLGEAGIFFSAPSATTSIFLPDAALGLGFRYKTLALGLASFQVFNSTVAPLLATIRLARYYHGHMEWETPLGIDWTCKIYLLWRLLPRVQDDALFTVSVLYQEMLTLGSTYRKQVGMAFLLPFNLILTTIHYYFHLLTTRPLFLPTQGSKTPWNWVWLT